jgi:hypothetical protein
MENRYLEKVSGFGGTLGKIVGKYAKNLTGETVRETQRAANLHKSMDAAAHASESMNKSFKDTMSRNGPKKNMGEFFLNREAKVQAKKSGMDQMRNAATKEVPHTTQSHVDSAIKARDATRKGTALAAGVAAGSMYSGARRRAQNEEYQYKYASDNRYLEKIALNLNGIKAGVKDVVDTVSGKSVKNAMKKFDRADIAAIKTKHNRDYYKKNLDEGGFNPGGQVHQLYERKFNSYNKADSKIQNIKTHREGVLKDTVAKTTEYRGVAGSAVGAANGAYRDKKHPIAGAATGAVIGGAVGRFVGGSMARGGV